MCTHIQTAGPTYPELTYSLLSIRAVEKTRIIELLIRNRVSVPMGDGLCEMERTTAANLLQTLWSPFDKCPAGGSILCTLGIRTNGMVATPVDRE